MSMNDGRLLVQRVNIDFSSTNILNSTWTQVVASLPQNVVRIDVTNTSADAVVIGLGKVGSEIAAAQIGQGATLSIPVLMNMSQRVSLQSVFVATLNAGRLEMAMYY